MTKSEELYKRLEEVLRELHASPKLIDAIADALFVDGYGNFDHQAFRVAAGYYLVDTDDARSRISAR